jgi:capsular polysaccharide transport system permease protein
MAPATCAELPDCVVTSETLEETQDGGKPSHHDVGTKVVCVNAPIKPEIINKINSLPKVRPLLRKARHRLVLTSFVAFVVIPSVVAFLYLYAIAADQYSSRASFSVRSDEFVNPFQILENFGSSGSSGASDSDILYEVIFGQELVERINARLDLEQIYSEPAFDPVFELRRNPSIEVLTRYWKRMIHVTYDRGSGIISIETFAFDPEDATAIAKAIIDESDALVDKLSSIARDAATRGAAEDLDLAIERLKEISVALSAFRRKHGIIDPTINLEAQMGLLTALQQELAQVYVQRDMLEGTTREDDPRIEQLDRQIAALEARIVQEQARLGDATTADGSDTMVNVFGDFERLKVDYEFANQSYVAASAAYDTALAEARRRSRYLASHIEPTLAQSAQYPRRFLLGLGVLGTLFLVWSIGLLSVYAARDR